MSAVPTNPKARVTVGMPVYNGERYLHLAIESVLAQTFPDFVLLISDNASTDRTPEICAEYAAMDRRIRYVRAEQNRGASWNFSNCVHLANTEYFKWQCYDDLMAPPMLEEAIAVLDAEPGTVLAYHQAAIIDEHGQTVQIWSDNIAMADPRPHVRMRQALYGRNKGWLESQFGVMRRSVLATTAMIGPQPHSDQILMLELALRGQFRELPDPHFLRRWHEGNSTANYDLKKIGAFLDPSRKNRVHLERLERLREYTRAIGRSPLSLADKLRCFAELRDLVIRKNLLKHVADDIAEALRSITSTYLKPS